jgi:hypothetical protein
MSLPLNIERDFGIFKLSSLTTFGRQVGKEITKLKKKSLILRFQTSKYNVKLCLFLLILKGMQYMFWTITYLVLHV